MSANPLSYNNILVVPQPGTNDKNYSTVTGADDDYFVGKRVYNFPGYAMSFKDWAPWVFKIDQVNFSTFQDPDRILVFDDTVDTPMGDIKYADDQWCYEPLYVLFSVGTPSNCLYLRLAPFIYNDGFYIAATAFDISGVWTCLTSGTATRLELGSYAWAIAQ